MIVDSHCHAWRYWPYEPPVPDPFSRPAVEQLLFEMDQYGVQEAVLVAARIDHNPDDNDYVAYCVRRFPDRLYQFADVDCMWTPTYHTPGAADRLAEAVRTYNLRGFTHYVDAADDGSWFFSDGGQAFFRTAASLNEIMASAGRPNIHIKLSGFHYATPVGWDYPHAASAFIVRALYEHFGPDRLHWGSDYPVVRWAM